MLVTLRSRGQMEATTAIKTGPGDPSRRYHGGCHPRLEPRPQHPPRPSGLRAGGGSEEPASTKSSANNRDAVTEILRSWCPVLNAAVLPFSTQRNPTPTHCVRLFNDLGHSLHFHLPLHVHHCLSLLCLLQIQVHLQMNMRLQLKSHNKGLLPQIYAILYEVL